MLSAKVGGSVEGIAASVEWQSYRRECRCDNLFRIESKQYIYNLSTKNYAPGNYILRVLFDNGTNYTVQIQLR